MPNPVAMPHARENSSRPLLGKLARRSPRAYWLLISLASLLITSCSAPPKTFATLDAVVPPAPPLIFDGPAAPLEDDPLVEELHELRKTVEHQLELPASDRSVHIHVFSDETSYREFARQSFPELADRRALFVEAGGMLNVFTRWGDEVAVDLRHEVTHGCLHASLRGLPLWLDEGLAEYYEVPSSASGWNNGHAIHLAAHHVAGDWRPHLERLEMLDRPGDMKQTDYAEAWAWTYWMLHGPREARAILGDYLREAQTGMPAIPISARLAARLERDPAPEVVELVRSGEVAVVVE